MADTTSLMGGLSGWADLPADLLCKVFQGAADTAWLLSRASTCWSQTALEAPQTRLTLVDRCGAAGGEANFTGHGCS